MKTATFQNYTGPLASHKHLISAAKSLRKAIEAECACTREMHVSGNSHRVSIHFIRAVDMRDALRALDRSAEGIFTASNGGLAMTKLRRTVESECAAAEQLVTLLKSDIES